MRWQVSNLNYINVIPFFHLLFFLFLHKQIPTCCCFFEKHSWERVNKNCFLWRTKLDFFLFWGNGEIMHKDRLPPMYALKETRAFGKKYGTATKVLLCFGGNGRSSGFSQMVRTKASRLRFLNDFFFINEHYKFDGIDYNWE